MRGGRYIIILVGLGLCLLALIQYTFHYRDNTAVFSTLNSHVTKSLNPESRTTIKILKMKQKADLKLEQNLSIGYEAQSQHLKVVFRSLEGCEKPHYMNDTGYRDKQCWISCSRGQACNNDLTDIKERRGKILCLPSSHLIGLRKCGTTDIAKWLQRHTPTAHFIILGNNIPRKTKCPLDYYKGIAGNFDTKSLYQHSPGNILFGSTQSRNRTHLVIQTTMQFIAFLDEPQTKYLLTLRNPTDRTLSYIHHAHKLNLIYRDKKGVLPPQFVHDIVVKYRSELLNCLEQLGERACIHLHNAADGEIPGLLAQGLYVVYLEELFSLLPREKIYINQLETYSKDQLTHARKFVTFLGHKIDERSMEKLVKSANERSAIGKKSSPLPETIKLLDELYKPFNFRLAKLLNNESWKYDRKDDS